MDMALPKGIPTHCHNATKKWSRLDQVFITEHSLDAIIICNMLPSERGVNTDHVPLVTVIDVELTKAPTQHASNFREVDWVKFYKKLEGKLDKLPNPSRISSLEQLGQVCNELTKQIQDTIATEVPTTEISTRSKRWWTKELTLLRKQADKLGRKSFELRSWPEHPIHSKHAKARKIYDKTIQYSKQHHWRDWFEKATDPDLWTAHKYISAPASDGGKTRIPNLTAQVGTTTSSCTTASNNTDKSTMLAKMFFPKKPQQTGNNTEETGPSPPVCRMDPLTKEQIRRHIARLRPYKAPGPDGIPNIVLIKCANLLINRLVTSR